MTHFWDNRTDTVSFDFNSDELPHNALIALDNVGIITLNGEESKSFLQGQLSNNIELLTDEKTLLAAHCDFKGKVWSIFTLLKDGLDIHLLTSQSILARSLAELKKYGVFAKTSINETTEDFVLLGALGEGAEKILLEQTEKLPKIDCCASLLSGKIICVAEQRYVLMLNAEDATLILNESTLPLVSHELWTLHNIRAAIPMLYESTINQFIPQMLNLQALDAISFTKGCYMGQEVVARTRYLGKNKRAMYVFSGTCEKTVSSGDEIEVQLGENWRRAGTVIAAVCFADKQIELTAVVASDSSEQMSFRIKNQPSSKLELKSLPYSLEELKDNAN